MIRRHWTMMLLLALAAAGVSATVPQTSSAEGGPVALLAQRAPAGFSDGGDSMAGGLVVVWAHRAPAGFSDGGDSVSGDDGLVAVVAQPSPDGFSDGGDGLMAILVQPTPDGFSDGGNGDGLVQPPLQAPIPPIDD